MLVLGRTVAGSRAATFDGVTSLAVAVIAPTEGAVGEATYDVLGIADDPSSGNG
jgi:hypothetical protein